jgi:hypothetical protein
VAPSPGKRDNLSVPLVTQMNLRGIRSAAAALSLLKLLGYEAAPLPYDASTVGLEGEALRLNSDRSPARGYGVLVAEIDHAPASLRTLGRRLVEQFHDRPLALLGVRDGSSQWQQLVVVRPRLIEGGSGSVSVAKLTIDVDRPTAHDAEVVSELAWDGADPAGSHERIDRALDVERVTKRFFEGLNRHYQQLEAAVEQAGERDASVHAGLERAGGAERVALRIVTQLLFCYFLQRKGLLEGDRGWLTRQFRASLARGAYYQRVLEPLFYEALARPHGERPAGWERPGIPFLNGGLFERHYGAVSLPLPDEVFSTDEGLLGFLDGWTFTVSEEQADESEVAVDPEMLGKIFENLVSEDELRREGTVYTPRPVVQFMCREALVPYLERETGIDERLARELLLDDERLPALAEAEGAERALSLARRLDDAVARIRVLDPAVGSGAFLLGMMGELIRLRRLCHRLLEGREAGPRELWRWKLHAVERSLFGVDINPTAIELCRLRLWLSLLVEEQSGRVRPLPNLEYRTVCADSLRDFVFGVEVQQTRSGALSLGLEIDDPDHLVTLRERYFEAFDPGEKERLRAELARAEDDLVGRVFARALENAREAAKSRAREARERGEAALEQLPSLREQFASRDRLFPAFLPAFHAPDVAREGGWHVVIMNPPYVGRKEVRQRFDAATVADLERHYGRTYDLMIHFGKRAFELSRPGGVVSMIFNDSIFTSTDATDFRRQLLAKDGPVTLLTIARTRCFQGKAVNGGVIVAVEEPRPDRPVRYVENHGRPPGELAGASVPAEPSAQPLPVGRSELWLCERRHYLRLPHRPLFRPSPEALALLDRYQECAAWEELASDWELLSETPRLERWKEKQRSLGFYRRLRERGRLVLLGLVVEGGQGLATADDRRFLAAIEGSAEAERARANRARLEALVLERPGPARLYRERRGAGRSVEEALLDVAERYTDRELGWPRSGLVRVAPPDRVRRTRLSEEEVASGIAEGPSFVPFEKGDDSGEDGGARWRRENPLVIDWSPEAVALLRRRARQAASYRKPYFRNEQLWGQGGVTWNSLARYLRARLVPEGAIFGHMAPTIRPVVDWLSLEALLALLNAPVLDFTVRTLLGSLMHIEIGDVRRLPIPLLSDERAARLHELGGRALAAKEALDRGERPAEPLQEIEAELDAYTRSLYGIRRDAELWVVR